MPREAKLRVCMSCELIFKAGEDTPDDDPYRCPDQKCRQVSYPAYQVYGKKVYQYYRTQKPGEPIIRVFSG